jgi:hypothetical protein
MSLISTQGEDDIIAKIKTIQGVDVIEGEYTADSYTPVLDAQKMFKPYMLVKFNAGYPAYDNGIVGPELDTLRATFSVFVVSPDDRTTRNLRDQVRVKMLTNFQPTDSSSLQPTGGYSFVDSDLGYQRYCHVVQFRYFTNLS